MAWTKVKLQGQFSKSERTLDDRTATLVFIAISDTDTTTVAAETASDGTTTIPTLLVTAITADTTRRATKISVTAEEEDPKRTFKVEVTFSSKWSENTTNPNPLSRPADVSWDFDDATETYFIDETDDGDGPKPVLNSASQRFQDLLERETGSITVTVTKNIGPTSYAAATAITLKDAINDGGITVDGIDIDAGQAKCKGWTCGGLQEENGVQYRVSKITLQLRPHWDHDVEDRGFYEFNDDGKLQEIIKGVPPTKADSPWPLDGGGVAQANADDDPALLTFKPYRSEAFDGLPLA